MVVCSVGPWACSGPVVQQPVILPPLEAGSDRCSVKASLTPFLPTSGPGRPKAFA
ncbi:hypothetical protein PAHAL_9G573800 [Panicum hallii]|uniref:Uncharacterized protein n=1 Tax=Panicum hallii TaxID=206008 RepID=A0A2T8I640_9POAL|nr:hypothetical protein PAHAL_9G573800 [Panicum hallii]